MKKVIWLFCFLFLIANIPILAQYSVKVEKFKPKKKYRPIRSDRSAAFTAKDFSPKQFIAYTPRYLVTEGGIMTSVCWISFQKVDKQYYLYTDYQDWENIELSPSRIENVTYIFEDGTELVIPVTTPFKIIEEPGFWTNYTVRSKVTEEEIENFSKRQLIAVIYNFKNSNKKCVAAVPKKKSIYLAEAAVYFLSGEKVTDEQVEVIFEDSQNYQAKNNKNWDF